MPEVCPRCESSEISIYPDRSGKCRRCNTAFSTPKTVDVVSPKPFSEVFGRSAEIESESRTEKPPEWRRQFKTTRAQSETLSPGPFESSAYGTATTSYGLPVTEIAWGKAIGYGLLVSILGGVLWGLTAYVTGYIFTLAAIAIGFGVAWAVKTGAGRINTSVIILAFLLTLFAIFIGDITAFSLVFSDYGGSVVDAIIHYPELVAILPGDICLGYIFGMLGAGYAAYSLWKQKDVKRVPGAPSPTPKYTPSYSDGIVTQASTATISDYEKLTFQVLERTGTRARLRMTLPPPNSQTLEAAFETVMGKATVSLNGLQVAKGRVWGKEKVMEIPLEKHPAGMVRVRFYGFPAPRIEVSIGGVVLATC